MTDYLCTLDIPVDFILCIPLTPGWAKKLIKQKDMPRCYLVQQRGFMPNARYQSRDLKHLYTAASDMFLLSAAHVFQIARLTADI